MIRDISKKVTDIVLNKKKLLQKYKKLNNDNLHISESNLNEFRSLRTKKNSKIFEYGYQRINLQLSNSSFDHPYVSLKNFSKPANSFFSYMSCGQVALSVAFFILRKESLNDIVINSNGVYYETFDFLKYFKFKVHLLKDEFNAKLSRRKKVVLLLDSSTDDIFKNFSRLLNIDTVIIDTTCISLLDRRLKKLIARFLNQKIRVILCRSHIKLDCWGSEYNRLGSLFIFNPQNKSIADLRKFRSHFNSVAGPLGARATLESIYPFINRSDFLHMNEKWICSIKSAHEAFFKIYTNKMSSLISCAQFVFYDHQLFFWVKFPQLSFPNVQQLAIEIEKELNKKNILTLRVPSYPWDFVALTTFSMQEQVTANKKREMSVLRICLGRLNKEQLVVFSDVIQSTFVKWII